MAFSRRALGRLGWTGAAAAAGVATWQSFGAATPVAAMAEPPSPTHRELLDQILAGVSDIQATLGGASGAGAPAPAKPTAKANPRILVLFDIDGTLSPARKTMGPEMREYLRGLRAKVTVGVVGGSDFVKQKEQLGDTVLQDFDYSFSENGLVAYKGDELLAKASIAQYLGEDAVKGIVNWVMRYMSDIECPVKRGTFIEFRTGMFNISPVGRNCSREERNAFEKYDEVHQIRPKMVKAMRAEFQDKFDLTFSIGGQISFDVFPTGWDKTYCLRFLPEADFDEVHFFGDKTYEGGNDFEIFSHPRTNGHTVTSPEDTLKQLKAIFGE